MDVTETGNHSTVCALQGSRVSSEGNQADDSYFDPQDGVISSYLAAQDLNYLSCNTHAKLAEKRKKTDDTLTDWFEENGRRKTPVDSPRRHKRRRRRRYSRFENERDQPWSKSSSQNEYCSDDEDDDQDDVDDENNDYDVTENDYGNECNITDRNNNKDDNYIYLRQENNNASSSSSDESFSDSDSDCGLCSSSSDSDDGDDEIDLRYYRNPCPQTCACRSFSNMSEVANKIPRNELFRTVEPLYNRVLKSRLLRCSNLCVNRCCKHVCCKDWGKDRPSVRQIRKDYRSSDLSVTNYSWGDWHTVGS